MSGSPPTASEAQAERAFGLLLFDAEETLARGQVEKAVVLASRAVRERPESLTARSLFDRARRELTRGRRREKLDARLAGARRSIETGDHAAAEKIVATVLKLLPDHAEALELFALLKDRRLGAGTAEAEAERELDAMMAARARQAASRARAALASGWSFRALMTVRRALALTPDDKELLALYAESLREFEKGAGERALRRAAHARVQAARGQLSRGEAAAAAAILRAVLKEDPGNPEARKALAEMERVVATAKPAPEPPPGVITGRFSHRTLVPPAARRAGATAHPRRPAAPPAWALAVAAGVLLVGAIAFARFGDEDPALPPPAAAAPMGIVAAPKREPASDPLAAEDPELSRAVRDVLTRYSGALENADAAMLAEARPDLPGEDRSRLIRRYRAANVATELRVQNVRRSGNVATVVVLRTDVVVGGPDEPAPEPESLRFERDESGAWVLRSPR